MNITETGSEPYARREGHLKNGELVAFRILCMFAHARPLTTDIAPGYDHITNGIGRVELLGQLLGGGRTGRGGVVRHARHFQKSYSLAMSTISVSDLKKKPASQWLKSPGKDDLVITSKGQSVAVLMRIAAAALKSIRALQAQSGLQQAAAANGAAELSMSDIDAEIAASRRARRRK